ncbi:GNAT family N-acetyltransferase [Leifsonia poae]|uniref:GNAT family N-acetyltransferase n=1 Tax=Leifsonia poae TaxID=110933 RepID=UPI003D676222
MTIDVRPADFADTRLSDFLAAYLDELAPTAPPESRHAFDFGALQQPSVRMFVAYDGDDIVGTGALSTIEPGHEELKSMRTAPTHRGKGIASLMLTHLLQDARSRDIARISLDTGSMDFFRPARALYAKSGFVTSEPYGRHVVDPNTVYMTLAL